MTRAFSVHRDLSVKSGKRGSELLEWEGGIKEEERVTWLCHGYRQDDGLGS